MPNIITQSSASLVPAPAIDLAFRVATLSDLPAIDALQRKYHKQLGFFPRAQMEEYLRNGWVVVAEERHEGTACPEQCRREAPAAAGKLRPEGKSDGGCAPSLPAAYCPLPTLLGYCVSRDRYLKRDELGVIYQLCVEPSAQRKFIGAALLRAVFERAPYGCKLYCCWCAQDIAANYFWESMGFVPLAFRAGSAKKARTHIFWQKRIVQGDESTPWWFPSQTNAGAIGEDRLVLPIPPGVRWSDQMPRILPEDRHEGTACPELRRRGAPAAAGKLRHEGVGGAELVPAALPSDPRPRGSGRRKADQVRRPSYGLAGSKLHFAPAAAAPIVKEKPARPKRKAAKMDPKLIAAGRELRDRWLEEVNAGRYLPEQMGKYEVGRDIRRVAGASVGLLAA